MPKKSGNNKTSFWLQALIDRSRFRWRYTISLIFIIAVTLILPKDSSLLYEFEVGAEWTAPDLKAPFDFPIVKSAESFRNESEILLKSIPPVFIRVKGIEQDAHERMRVFFENYIRLEALWRRTYDAREPNRTNLNDINPQIDALSKQIDRATIIAALQTGQDPIKLKEFSFQVMDSLYKVGFIDKKLDELTGKIISLRENPSTEILRDLRVVFDKLKTEEFIERNGKKLPPSVNRLIVQLILNYCKPNYIFDQTLYSEEQTAELSALSRYYGKIKKDDKIIDRGEKITPEIIVILESLNVETERRSADGEAWYASYNLLGQALIVFIIVIITVWYLRKSHERIFTDFRRFSLLFSIYFSMILGLSVAHWLSNRYVGDYEINFFYAAPLCIAPMMVTVFFDAYIGFYTTVVLALFASLINQNSFEFFFTQTIVGTITILNLKDSRLIKRSQIFYLAGWILAAYIVVFLAYSLYTKGSFEKINYNNILLFFVNVAFTLAAYPLIFLFERIFGVTSNLTLLELLDTNHPLMVSLYEKAPGTFQHSLQVANIAEEAARAIKADPLLAHVGALFHDIGKVYEPQYFTENIDKNAENPHKKLSPDQSAQKIIEHVTRGGVLAQEHRLPTAIVEFIYSHHGTTRVESFYRQYIALHPDAAGTPEIETKFRYKGRLPRSKETTIVMISDSIEAASRSLEAPTKEDLEKLIEMIVAGKINDNQLIESPLTFKDLIKIKREMLQTLVSIHHNRTRYPGPAKTPPMPK